MKSLFIEARRKNLTLGERAREFVSKHKEFSIIYSIQFKELAEKFKKEAEKQGKKILSFTQVLGCSFPKLKPSTIILIGSGRFHAVNLASRLKLPIYILEQDTIKEVTKEEIEKLETKKKVSMLKFLHADEVGILVSSKPGQNKTSLALKLKEKLEKKGKKAYLFIADNISLQELENYTLPIYINTACPGLALDSSKIINLEDLKDY